MAKCICLDWRANIEQINGPIKLQQFRTGVGYQGKRFTHCPWCGCELQLEASDYAEHSSAGERHE